MQSQVAEQTQKLKERNFRSWSWSWRLVGWESDGKMMVEIFWENDGGDFLGK